MSELHRFTHQLVESLSSHDPSAIGTPVSLEDITRRVLPYRACRRLFGILNVEDYELLIMRLVAGEGGLAAASPLAAVERCRAELDSGHPDPGVVNDLEGVTLRLSLGAIALGDVVSEEAGGSIVRSYSLYEPEAAPEPEPEPEPELEPELELELEPEAVEESHAAQEPVESLEAEAEQEPEEDETIASPEPEPEADPFQELFDAPGDSTEPEPEVPEPSAPPAPITTAPPEPVAPPPPAAHGEPPPRCPHCASRLPSGRPVRFCPHCGSNVVPLQCASCGAGLEPAWRHCVLCGAPAVNDSRFA